MAGGEEHRRALKELLQNWRDILPLAGLAALACVGLFFLLRKKSEDAADLERQRRAYLNRIGRIVEGQVLEFTDHTRDEPDESPLGTEGGKDAGKDVGKNAGKQASGSGMLAGRRSPSSGIQKLLYYTYSISGVTYETAQDITGLEERLHLSRVAAGQVASVKYDPSNPSNSILLADDWSGLH
jgi:hypothetical protein